VGYEGHLQSSGHFQTVYFKLIRLEPWLHRWWSSWSSLWPTWQS